MVFAGLLTYELFSLCRIFSFIFNLGKIIHSINSSIYRVITVRKSLEIRKTRICENTLC